LAALRPEPTFQHVILVGGFAASDWLFNKVRDKLIPHGLNIIRPENHVSVLRSLEIHPILCNLVLRNKAVSDGALSFYHDLFVRTRVSKFTYGCFSNTPFDPTDLDHLKVYFPHEWSLFFKVFIEYGGFGDEGVQKKRFVEIKVEGWFKGGS